MKTRKVSIGLAILSMLVGLGRPVLGAETRPYLATFSVPAAGSMQIVFRGQTGPFVVQSRDSLDAGAWTDVPDAVITELEAGVFMALVPAPNHPMDLGFYRIVSQGDPNSELKGWAVVLQVSAPPNGTHFVAGDSPVVKVTILDNFAQGLSGLNRTNFSTLGLYAYGPEDPMKAFTPVKLLGATADRTKTPHHYIDLRSDPGVQVDGSTLTYSLKPVSDEPAGSYTLGVRAILSSDRIQTTVEYAKIQIGTPPPAETTVVSRDKCAACHLGPISGKIYMAHIDVSSRSPAGDWARDYMPVTSCKLCHNNEGPAAYSSVNGGITNRVSDHIVNRVHGVHNGANLKLDANTNQVDGLFEAYLDLEFPAEIKNCTACHADDRWKTQPSRLACGSCHDNVWFGADPAPAGTVAHPFPQSSDAGCTGCHHPDPPSPFSSIAEVHQIPKPPMNLVDLTLSPPANTNYYVAGETPVVSIVFKDDAGNPIADHTLVDSAHFSSASLFVYGPRSLSEPVLTSMAKLGVETKRASVTCNTDGPWDINGKTLKIGINGTAPRDIVITGTSGAVTPAEVVASLNSVITNATDLNGGAKASVSSKKVGIKTLIRGANARIEIDNGDVTTAMGWKAAGVVLEPDVTVAAVSTPSNDLRPVTDPLEFNDPMVTRTTTNIQYALDDVKGLAPGTYCAFVYFTPKTNALPALTNWAGLGFTTFQVGTATEEKKIAGNCMACHSGTPFHLYEKIGEPAMSAHVHPALFDADQCRACHDYGHPNTGDMFKNQGGTSLNGWSGFGAMPISRRVHGVHYAHYLEHSEEIYANATKDTFGGIIFPQDVRNCTKCHAESDTWKQKPSRMACLACHDSDAAKAHGRLMTDIADPSDPYGPTAVESCEVCHGEDAEFSPDKVHRISNPYVPPYPREPAP